MFARLGLLLCAQLLAAGVFVVLSRAESGRPRGTREIPCAPPLRPHKLTMIFVDSLSDRVAKDERVMPELSALARRGVALDVSPCRDQLTYLCLRALLTGYDESSLLAVSSNFNRAQEQSDNLLEHLARAGRRVVVVGSHDFEPYASALYRSRFRDGSPAGDALALADLARIDPEQTADVTLISLSSGDRTAHELGTHSAAYRASFAAIDQIIGDAVRRAGEDSDLFVFGDHGHDEMGRHLPGLPSTTYAVYAGPSFRNNVQLRATLSDHRAILGVLLGVPSPPSYSGPELDRLFSADPTRALALSSRALRRPELRTNSQAKRELLAIASLAFAVWIGRRALSHTGIGRTWSTILAALGGAALAAAGAFYDAVRYRIHDHGSEPWRSLWLLVPLALGVLLAVVRSQRLALPTLERAAFASLLIAFALLFPNAYYYGATRATLLTAMVAISVVLGVRLRSVSGTRKRLLVSCGVVVAQLLLWSLYGLHDVGGRTREMAYFVFSSRFFARDASFTLSVTYLGLWGCGALFGRGSRFDARLSFALMLLSLCLAQLHVADWRWLTVVCGLGYLGLHLRPQTRLVTTRWFLGLLAIGQCYAQDSLHVAPMAVLWLCAALLFEVFRALLEGEPRARAAASGATLAIAAYLMLWPTLGMRFSGIDFRFMFAWVPIARYEELWWVIGLGTLIKVVWPFALLVDLARRASPTASLAWAYFAFCLKLSALSVFAAFYGTNHALLSNGALEILAELSLLLLVSVLSWPSPLRGLRALERALEARMRRRSVATLLGRSA